MNKLIFLETIPQVRWFAQGAPPDIRESTPVVISSNAAYACQQYGLSYLKVEEYADIAKRCREITPVVKRYLEFESWLDSWAGQAMPMFAERGFLPASCASFLIQLLFVEIWSTTMCLKEMLSATRPDEVLFWSPTIAEVPTYTHPNVSPIPAILADVAQNLRIAAKDLSNTVPNLSPIANFHTLPPSHARDTWEYTISRLKDLKIFLKQIPAMVHLHTIRKRIFGEFIDFISAMLVQKAHVLCSGFHYDLLYTIRALRKQGIRVTVLDDLPISFLRASPNCTSDMARRMAQAGSELLQEPLVWAPLEEWGITQKIALWSKPLDFWWNRLVPLLWERYRLVLHILEKKKIDAVLTWDTTGSTLSSAADNAARTANVPCYIYQHGSSCEVDPLTWQCFIRPYQTLFVYGNGTVEMLESRMPSFLHPHARIIPVGSARLDALSSSRPVYQSDDRRPTILYIPTMFDGYGRIFGGLAAYPDVSYLELLQRILSLWKDVPEIRLLYKDFITGNNTDRVMARFIREHIPNGTVTYLHPTYLMWRVDAIIVDHVITAIGEVLLTKKQVLVYMPKTEISHPEARRLLRKRAIVCETPEEFEAQVRLLLQMKSYPEIEQPDDEFLRTYCTHLNDGLSAERAATFIAKDLYDRRKQNLPHE